MSQAVLCCGVLLQDSWSKVGQNAERVSRSHVVCQQCWVCCWWTSRHHVCRTIWWIISHPSCACINSVD